MGYTSKILSLAVYISFLCWVPLPAYGIPIALLHKPPRAETLPPPGQMIKLPLVLQGTQKFDYLIRVQVVRDGAFMDVTIPQGTLDEQDRPLYILSLPAPVRELKYRFLLYGDDRTILGETEEFSANRLCAPLLSDVQLTDANQKSPDSDQGIETANQIALRSRTLERHILAYETAIALLDEIDTVLKGASNSRATGVEKSGVQKP